jgi:hypothetical protein
MNYKKSAPSVLGILGTMVFGILFIAFTLEGIDSLTASKEMCYLENVTYPTYYPATSQEVESSGNFIDCRCGKTCFSNLGSCIRLISNTSSIKILNENLGDNNKCTFTGDICPNEKTGTKAQNALNEAYNLAEPYINLLNSSNPVECWESKERLYLHNDKTNAIVKMSVTGGLVIVSVILIIFNK